ncbi:GNAT family N-acetyltransferase [Massilia sp. CCM 9210]|uniref:GNAT family N-acetyltransferase n=1 Tax=Massilia scottii TaxID=3057166 RepID=UPI002796BB04|nr:GNAT family N-acetyltransferase [Massilia sp. CCM 9210]MDQ1813041.1 GNAT family N-acetyltransferase [Massilia sp. CCM 9210]
MNIPEKLRSIKASLSERSRERKRLRGPADLNYAIADSIELLDAGAWQALADHAGFFMSFAYLKSLEQVLPHNLSPRYALIYSGAGAERMPVAAVYMQIADLNLAQARPDKSQAASTRAAPLDELAKKTTQRILSCGNLLTFGQHGIAMAPGADPKLAWHGVAEVLYRVRQADKLVGKTHFIMIKDLHAPHTDHAAHLEHLSYRYVETEPNMVLALQDDWKHYDDYLASLASKYRSGVRNAVFKTLDEAACTLEQLSDLDAVREQIHGLYKEVQVNAGFRPFELRPEYFPALQKAAGERFRCSVLKRDGEMLGFLISVADGDTSIAYHIGFNRAAAADLPIYLRLLHAGIADALSMGCKQVSFGRTALEPKAALGAKPQTFGILVRHRQPVLNKMIKHLLLGIEHDDAPERSPFKKPAKVA